MKENKQIKKELLFKSNIKDITSISLDSNYIIENNNLVGNFIIDGEYKTHELSLNKEKFNFKIPIKEELKDNIKIDTINLEINDFTYDYKKDQLIVNIEYTISGDEEIIEFDSKELLDDYLRDKEVDIIDEEVLNEKEEILNNPIEEKKDNSINILKEEPEEERKIESLEETTVKKEEKDENIEEVVIKENSERNDNIDEVINKVNENTEFITYKIYTLKEDETIDSLIIKYHTTIDDLQEYNDLSNINVGDKLIIPTNE